MDESEQRIEKMIANGKAVMSEAIAACKPVAIVAAFSGGNDSIVASHFAIEHYDAFAFTADTLIGLGPARQHSRDVCKKLGWEHRVIEATPEGPPKKTRRGKPFDQGVLPAGKWTDGATAYEEFCLNHGFPGRGKPQHARMYQRLKERSFRKLLKEFGATASAKTPKVLFVSGVRSDESSRRAGYRRTWKAGYFGDVWVNPFYYHTAADFALYRDEFGLPDNPVKRRCGISGECCCGTFGSQDERAAYREIDPAFADYLDELEIRVKANGLPWGWGESPPEWWKDQRKGQGFLFEVADQQVSTFQPACVGCHNGRR